MIDIHSDTWQIIEKYCLEAKSAATKSLIEGSDQDNRLRGEIQFIDRLLGMPRTAPPPIVASSDYS
ncbi:hypothetical protein KC887_03505 [Candidatus Kaiserbacteria bacterium]|nr:hypothetical protein [Candidatus Kaiserbacteria bacterium]